MEGGRAARRPAAPRARRAAPRDRLDEEPERDEAGIAVAARAPGGASSGSARTASRTSARPRRAASARRRRRGRSPGGRNARPATGSRRRARGTAATRAGPLACARELARGDALLAAGLEPRERRGRDRRVQAERAFVGELRRERRGRHHLRERGDVEQIVAAEAARRAPRARRGSSRGRAARRRAPPRTSARDALAPAPPRARRRRARGRASRDAPPPLRPAVEEQPRRARLAGRGATSVARAPSGSAKFASSWPRDALDRGHAEREDASAHHVGAVGVGVVAAGELAHRDPGDARAARRRAARCVRYRSIRYGFSPTSSRRRIAPSSLGAYGVPARCERSVSEPPRSGVVTRPRTVRSPGEAGARRGARPSSEIGALRRSTASRWRSASSGSAGAASRPVRAPSRGPALFSARGARSRRRSRGELGAGEERRGIDRGEQPHGAVAAARRRSRAASGSATASRHSSARRASSPARYRQRSATSSPRHEPERPSRAEGLEPALERLGVERARGGDDADDVPGRSAGGRITAAAGYARAASRSRRRRGASRGARAGRSRPVRRPTRDRHSLPPCS